MVSEQSVELPDTVPPRRFEFADDHSYKFWTIALDGCVLTIRHGRIGNAGQTREVRCDSVSDAKRDYISRIRRKTREGYVERFPTKTKAVTSQDAWDALADHEPFLAAIQESPDDLTTFSVYADWLIEQQDPRGEFIRLQLALEDPALPMYRRPKLEKAAELIRQRSARTWLGNLAPWLMDDASSRYAYEFRRGQLSSIRCGSLSHRFAFELVRSPFCRLLTELAIASTELLTEATQIDGHDFEADRDYGIQSLLGGDFGNLRELRIGVMPDSLLPTREFSNTESLITWIASMGRLERLWLQTRLDLPALWNTPLDRLTELHVQMDRRDVASFAESGKLSQLKILGLFNPITDDLVDALVKVEGFRELTQFVCHDVSAASDHAMERLRQTGVVLDVIHFPGSKNNASA